VARMDEQMERCHPSKTPESAELIERICSSARDENRAMAARLACIGELFGYRLSRCSENEDWAIDTMDAVAAEVGAAQRISQALALDLVGHARAMRERFPKLGEVFAAGDIDYRTFQTIVYRTDLITDREILADVDAKLAANVTRWPSLSRGRLSAQVDKIVAKADADAVRRRKERQRDRQISIWQDHGGMSRIEGSLLTPDAQAVDQRLDGLAATVCEHDPRSRVQRRADALGALVAGADRLGCRCGRTDCAAGTRRPASPVTIHVIAEQATVAGTGAAPGAAPGVDGLIPPELVAELAQSAKLVPLINPGDCPPEPGYTPSKALADFVRCRDLTCRWPGCDHPAWDCQLDHTIAHADGGPTHAANLVCLCITHHLLKTFLDWAHKQLADGTLILTAPSGHTYVTTPGSALLFPSLCQAVGGMPAAEAVVALDDDCGERTAMMPRRRRTRAQNRAQRVAAERKHNREARHAAAQARANAETQALQANPPPGYNPDPDEPPPF
jgi:hypothetical protein